MKSTDDVTQADLKYLHKRIGLLARSLRQSIYNHRYYMTHRGRLQKLAGKYRDRMERAERNIRALRGLLDVMKLPQKMETRAGRKYLVRLSRAEYCKLKGM